MSLRTLLLAVGFIASVTAAGCGTQQPTPAPSPPPADGGYGYDYGYGPSEITFLVDAPANADPDSDAGLSDLTFTSADGSQMKLRDRLGPRGGVVVVTRGATNPICPYCSTQTAHYVRDYEQFQSRGVEVLLVYPVATIEQRSQWTAFLADARAKLADPQRPVPFPVLFDVELTAVDRLGIKQDLSKPATYIVDAAGNVRYGYVGAHLADRPSTKAVLGQLDRLLGPTTPAAVPADAPPSTAPPSTATNPE